ncbi:hypothetical protein [Pannonibacter phragmitetus]|nr:hypothetical protein [Pannonibacter phragmitetus]
MEDAMPVNWSIEADWETLEGAPAEENACFAALGICVNGHWLTEGHDYLANRLRTKPYLSAYHLAEWLAWNWWRLRWEPRSAASEWGQSHNLSSIGEGYIWPNINIFSDGERTALISEPTDERPATPFRYISSYAAVMPSGQFEAGLDEFFLQVLNRLDAEGVKATNFHSIWSSLKEERASSSLTMRRRLEALLGVDPDEGDTAFIDRLVHDADDVSLPAIEEIAANRGDRGLQLTVQDLKQVAQSSGFELAAKNAVRLHDRSGLHPSGSIPAWLIGARAAQALRDQEKIGGGPISDKTLTEMAGASETVLKTDQQGTVGFAFAIDDERDKGHLVLRSKWLNGRRFELARVIGDRLMASSANKLFPATKAHTYRQKMQRAFAAELLSPFNEVEEALNGDYSAENQSDVAQYFNVSELTIRTLLVNHHRIPRDKIDGDFDSAAA